MLLMDNKANHLTELRDMMTDEWFGSLKIGDKVYNYADKWKNKEIIESKLREGIIKEIYDNGKYDRYVIVDNLTTGRQNKWGDYALVKPKEIEDISNELHQQMSMVYENNFAQKPDKTEETIDKRRAQDEYESLIANAEEHLKDEKIQSGKCKGIYGAFNKDTNECIYIGKSKYLIYTRWREHKRFWKKLRPIHRQLLLTQYLHYFGDQIEWRVLLPIDDSVNNDLIEYAERRLFERYRPIANSIIPNGTIFGRSFMEGEGDSITVSEWNSNMVTIKIHKGKFDGFSDGKNHFK